jgi:uncharacterized protein
MKEGACAWPELSVAAWLWLGLAGVLIGVAKTAISGVGSLAIVIFAAALPARESTGAVLPLLLCGDVVAVAYYRRHADWAILGRLLPRVAVAVGATAGFATMTANAAGPVTTLYLIIAGLPKLEMLGTGAWFYLTVNLAKVPLSAGLGLITPDSLAMDAVLVPAMLCGAVGGVALIRTMSQNRFEIVALAFGAAAALLLLL